MLQLSSVNICIYCKNRIIEENICHIIPESLGNKDYVFNPPQECKNCNHNLAYLESALLDFPSVKLARTLGGIFNKEGKVPESSFQNIRAIKDADTMHIYTSGKEIKKIKNTKEITFTMNFSAQKLKQVLRGLYKIGLGHISQQLGSELALSPRFDGVRDIISGTLDFDGYLILKAERKPTNVLRIDAREFTNNKTGGSYYMFYINIFGTLMVYDIERRILDYPDKMPDGTIYYLTNP